PFQQLSKCLFSPARGYLMFATVQVLSRSLALGFCYLTLSGCAGTGMSLGDILAAGGVYGGDVSGEVRRIDTQRREIEVRSGWGGAERVRYDGRTQVYYGQRRYDVRDLERGDLVRMRVEQERRGERYATVIEVRGNASGRGGRGGREGGLARRGGRGRGRGGLEQDRRGERYATVIEVRGNASDRGGRGERSGRLERLGGSVARIDDRAGWFEVVPGRSRAVRVILPYDPPRSVRDRFRRLR